MSQKNVEVVQGVYETLNRGDLAAVLGRIDPDFEWWARDNAPEDALVRGPEGFKAQWESIVDVLGEFRQEPKEFIDAGDYVVVPVMQVGRGRASRASIEQHEVHAFRLRDGMLVELREYHDKDEALKAIGLA
jgi:uncharacterized protein